MDTLQILFQTVKNMQTKITLPGKFPQELMISLKLCKDKMCNVCITLISPPLLAGWDMKSLSVLFTVKIVFGESYLPLFRSALSSRKVVSAVWA